MKKVRECGNCGTENPFYEQNCTNCNAFLRSKIANIDLWSTLWQIMESPVKTAENIIQADHKNFLLSILLFAAVKIGLTFYLVTNAFTLYENGIANSIDFILLSALSFILIITLCSLIITFINSMAGIKNRFKDNLTIYTYSFIPIVLIFIFLTPIEIALFGTYWFTFNPSPLVFKPLATYILFFIEGIFFLWSCFLLATSTYSQTSNIIYSIVIGILIFTAVSFGLYASIGAFY